MKFKTFKNLLNLNLCFLRLFKCFRSILTSLINTSPDLRCVDLILDLLQPCEDEEQQRRQQQSNRQMSCL